MTCRCSSASFFFFYVCGPPRDLPSSPTRRSSDLLESGASLCPSSNPARRPLPSETCHRRSLARTRFEDRQQPGHFQRLLQVRPEMTKLEASAFRSEEHTSELQSQSNLVCRLLLDK